MAEIIKTLTSTIIVPNENGKQRQRKYLIKSMHLPDWGGQLDFRPADKGELMRLKEVYDKAWGSEITISTDQLASSIKNFPDGQLVGVEKDHDTPVSMINIMLGIFDPKAGFPCGYANVTGDRTFSTSIALPSLNERLDGRDDLLGIAYCISIAVDPKYGKSGYAFETLNYAILLATVNGLIPTPYSAPRGFGKARKMNPALDIFDYLHMTKPFGQPFEAYLAKVGAISNRLAPVFGGTFFLSKELFERYQNLPIDPLESKIDDTAFGIFTKIDAPIYAWKSKRDGLTIEDFCLLTGRVLRDPVIGMHVSNGARFIRDGFGGITAVFKDSRPEDSSALGYNIVLSYGYHPLLGHPSSIG